MEQTTDLFPLYQELLLASFDKILNALPKKHQQIKELIAKSSGMTFHFLPQPMKNNQFCFTRANQSWKLQLHECKQVFYHLQAVHGDQIQQVDRNRAVLYPGFYKYRKLVLILPRYRN